MEENHIPFPQRKREREENPRFFFIALGGWYFNIFIISFFQGPNLNSNYESIEMYLEAEVNQGKHKIRFLIFFTQRCFFVKLDWNRSSDSWGENVNVKKFLDKQTEIFTEDDGDHKSSQELGKRKFRFFLPEYLMYGVKHWISVSNQRLYRECVYIYGNEVY